VTLLLPCPPRFGTQLDLDAPTLGVDVAATAAMLSGDQLMPHQLHVALVSGRLEPVGDELRRLYDTVVLVMPRQNGKTTLLEAQMITASRRPRRFAGGKRPCRRTVVYTAQDRQMARERIITELVDERLEGNPYYAGRYRPRRSNGSESITWKDTRGRIMVQASTDEAGHGLTVDDAVLDEAFSHDDLTVVNALQPPMITRDDPQLWIVSTVGDGSDGLLQHYQEVGRLSLRDPDTRIAYFEWSATDDDDRADPAVWRRVMPALGLTITEQRVRSYLTQAGTTGVAEFDRAYLCRRTVQAVRAGIDPQQWARCLNVSGAVLDLVGPVVAGIALTADRSASVIAVSGRTLDGRVGVVVDQRPGTAWLADAVVALAHRDGLTLYDVRADRRAGAGGIIDQLAGRGIDVTELVAGDVASHAGTLHDMVADRVVVHDGQTELTDAVAGSRRRQLGDTWALSLLDSVGDVSPLVAASFAVGGYLQHFPVGVSVGAGVS
jgi:phage terminase large subunit-like protein